MIHSVECQELFLTQGGTISHLDLDGDDDAASTLVTELMQFSTELADEAQGQEEQGVVVCWSCGEVYAASLAVCGSCGEAPL